MHVLQWITVQADNTDMAFDTVKDTLESELGNNDYSSNAWFDWFVVGGGRWNPNPDSQYKEDDHSMVVSYGAEPDKFIETINNAMESRMAEFRGYRERFEAQNLDINAKLDSYDGSMDFSMEMYELSKLTDMLQGKWNMDSYFYDLNNWSTNTKWVLDTLDDSWYLVPVDFHF